MKIEIIRNRSGKPYTEGELYIDGKKFCDTLEDKWRDLSRELKIHGQTAIPAGKYWMRLSMSNRFKKLMPELLNVPLFTGIRIHSGNTKEDTDGCILIGKAVAPGYIVESRKTFNAFMKVLQDDGNDKWLIEIK